MDDLLDMITTDESPSQVSDKIKELLFAKSAEKIDAYRPSVSDSMFGTEESVDDVEEDITPDEE
jgi:hypothetical protein|tara:strand:- start:3240 stop:3431 length:192 start_codon:yes stop_codon:yes gene_type:complete